MAVQISKTVEQKDNSDDEQIHTRDHSSIKIRPAPTQLIVRLFLTHSVVYGVELALCGTVTVTLVELFVVVELYVVGERGFAAGVD